MVSHHRGARAVPRRGRWGAWVGFAALTATLVPALALDTSASAAPSADPSSVWTPTSVRPTASAGRTPTVTPDDFRAYSLDLDALSTSLGTQSTAAGKGARAAQTTRLVQVPAPDGELVTFEVAPSPVMEARLARQHPEISTWAGTAVGSAATIRLDVTPAGFHASVRGAGAAWYVDPAWVGDDSAYLSYEGRSLPAPQRGLIEPEVVTSELGHAVHRAARRTQEGQGEAVKLRTYRLALLTDNSYANYVAPA